MANVALTRKMIMDTPDLKSLIELPAIQDNWVKTYNSVTGKEDGELKFNAEKILFLQTISSSKALEKCDKFTIYSSFIELAISGLTLRDGLAYIIPYGKTASFMPGWRGRLEQINEMPNVVHCHEPQVVYDCDEFDYEKGTKVVINKHKPGVRTKESRPTHVYFVIEFKHGPDVYIMDAIDVINIRDTYSSSYKQYVADCKAANKQIGDTFEKTMNGPSGTWNIKIEPPMWVSDEAQAFKKTIVKRVYGTLPKLPKQKWLDERTANLAEKIDADEAAAEIAPKKEEKRFDNYLTIIDDTTTDTGSATTSTPPASTNGAQNTPASASSNGQPAAEIKTDDDLKSLAQNPEEGF